MKRGINVLFNKSAMKYVRVIFAVIIMLWMEGLRAKPNPDNYFISVRTQTSYYDKYKIIALTDSSLTIFKEGLKENDSIKNPITLFARDIESISTIHNGHLPFMWTVITCSVGGLMAGIIGWYNSSPTHSPFVPDFSNLLPVGGFFSGLVLGSFVGFFVDNLANRRFYEIQMNQVNFLEFKNKFGTNKYLK